MTQMTFPNVIPVETGIQCILDSCLRRNDKEIQIA